MAYRKPFKYKPINPRKYMGDPSQIWMRSMWEKKMAAKLDLSSSVKAWASEETVIPYLSPVDNKMHRYFMDFTVVTHTNQVILIEVKPHNQTIAPKLTKKKTEKRLLTETMTYMVNKAKWDATEAYCKAKGWRFIKATEKNFNFTI